MSGGIQDELQRMHDMGLLEGLLEDRTTKKNILWGTDAYSGEGWEYQKEKEIHAVLITGSHKGLVKNRAQKAREQRTERTRQYAEVFTPAWVCEKMNRFADAVWFGKINVAVTDVMLEGKNGFLKEKDWKRYIDSRRMELTCGEAPYLASRYDVATGEAIELGRRIGILDWKLQTVNAYAADEETWMKWTIRAFQAVYGYEFQGDNLLIARVNLLMTFEEYLYARWKRSPTESEYRRIIRIITWNIWQMDGLTGSVPYAKKDEYEQITLFDWMGGTETEKQTLVPEKCRIYDWRNQKSLEYLQMKGRRKKMKFDFVIGNPPYQDETLGENKGYAPPIYHKFLENAYEIADVVEMIHPARFLFNAGSTPKAWNKKMLNDTHLKVLWYEQDSSKVFNNTDIKGGVVITCHDRKKVYGAIQTFTAYEELNGILKKVCSNSKSKFSSFSEIVITRTAYRFTDKMHQEHPEAIKQLSEGHAYDMSTNIFSRLPQIFFDEEPNDMKEYIRILGREKNERVYKYIRRDYVNAGRNLDKHKIFLPKANGIGILGEALSSPILAVPGIGATETFLSIGAFETKKEAVTALKYIKTKFARILLGVLKTTQDITPDKWKYVPLQDFTPASDIDWSQSIADIDRQLYAKYGLDETEITFIESHVKEMM